MSGFCIITRVLFTIASVVRYLTGEESNLAVHLNALAWERQYGHELVRFVSNGERVMR